MNIPNNPFLGTHYIGKEEIKAANEVLKSKSLFRYQGPNLKYKTLEFEKNMAEYLGVKYVLGCTNGTSALKLCFIANDIGPGDEVLMTPFTFIASAGSILSCGAVPKFIDVDATMNIDPSKLEENIGKNTKAILVVHIQGQPCDMEKIMAIAHKHNLIVIEDAAQALGAELKGKKAGTFGKCSAFSLQAGKTITCGEGGFLATNDEKIYKKAKMYHDNGGFRIGDNYPTWENGTTFFGENFKMNELQSAIANEQLKKINNILDHQQTLYYDIVNNIDLDFYKLRPSVPNSILVHSNLSIIFDDEQDCAKFIRFMNKNGIGFTNQCNNLINQFDTFRKQQSWHHTGFPYNLSEFEETECYISKSLFKRVAWFSLSAELKQSHIKYIVKKLNEYQNEF